MRKLRSDQHEDGAAKIAFEADQTVLQIPRNWRTEKIWLAAVEIPEKTPTVEKQLSLVFENLRRKKSPRLRNTPLSR